MWSVWHSFQLVFPPLCHPFPFLRKNPASPLDMISYCITKQQGQQQFGGIMPAWKAYSITTWNSSSSLRLPQLAEDQERATCVASHFPPSWNLELGEKKTGPLTPIDPYSEWRGIYFLDELGDGKKQRPISCLFPPDQRLPRGTSHWIRSSNRWAVLVLSFSKAGVQIPRGWVWYKNLSRRGEELPCCPSTFSEKQQISLASSPV